MALGVALGLCWGVLGAAVADGAHRWDVRVTGVTGEDGSHRCAMVGQLDDFRQMDYSTARQQVKPTGAWMAQAVGQAYFQAKTRDFLYYEKTSKLETGRWMRLNNHTGGSHVMQVHVGCTMEGDIPTGARFQYAYDGRDFISFDTRTGTWVAAVAVAVPQKRRWDTEGHWNRFAQWYLQRECLETLRSLVRVGKETLERQVPPEVSVSRRDAPHGPVTLSCRASGFYPRPIHLFWVRDGGDVLAETSSSGILPLADGTYHTQSSLEIGPRPDGPRYACRVEHSSLPAPVLVWAPEKGPLPPGVLAAIVLAVLGLAGAAGAGVWLWRRKSAGKTGEDSASSSASGTEPRSAGSRS
ncbi:class I histocompatibility antigen, F10 alpha chain-like isoform X6 [Pelodiscus sinensis]|uniref:class I histocompatibility antigen, F10 alpha chain-like isoform X6 n=1 Tax=Pelodiscus sinensis TaxID=13735 RepID=UPI003F6CBF79